MKKLPILILLIILGFFISFYGHWLLGLLAGFLVIWTGKVPGRDSWWLGFLAYFLIWGSYAYFQDAMNEGLLSEQIGNLLGGTSSYGLLLITAMMGGLAGLLTAWLASALQLGGGQKSNH